MLLPPITAQIITDLPPGLKDLGEVVIIAAALLGVVYAIRPLISAFVGSYKELASVNRELLTALRSSDRAHDRAADEIKALRQDATANQDEARTTAKAQSEALSMLVKSQAGIMEQVVSQAAAITAHDAFAREGIARLEAQGARLIEMVESGQKVSRAELTQLSRDILAAIHSLTPPQPPPVALRVEPNPAKEGNAA